MPEERVRVVHFGKYAFFKPGGIETHVETLTRGLAAAGLDVTVLSYADASNARPTSDTGGVTVIPVPSHGRVMSLPIAPGLVGAARKLGRRRPAPQIAHLHWPDPSSHLAATLGLSKAAWVASWHSDIVRQRLAGHAYHAASRLLLRTPDALAAATSVHLQSDQIATSIAIRRVIPYGVDIARFDATPAVLQAAAELRPRLARGRGTVVLALGRHVYYKGFAHLIEAMRSLPDATLVLGGRGPLSDELESLAGAQDNVVFAGEIAADQLAAYYRAADMFCLPSVAPSEAFGLVQAEAMASEWPIVNCRLGTGVNEVAPDGVCALTVEPGDAGALAQALRRLIDDGPLRRRLGAAGRERVERDYSVDAMVRQTITLYHEVLARRAGTRG